MLRADHHAFPSMLTAKACMNDQKPIWLHIHNQTPNVLYPIRLDNAVVETRASWVDDIKSTRHIGDFTNWKNHDDYQKAFNRLIRALKAK